MKNLQNLVNKHKILRSTTYLSAVRKEELNTAPKYTTITRLPRTL